MQYRWYVFCILFFNGRSSAVVHIQDAEYSHCFRTDHGFVSNAPCKGWILLDSIVYPIIGSNHFLIRIGRI